MRNKKEVKWFSHDHDAINDPRIILLMSKHGFSGYGRWWRVVEMLRNSDDYQMYVGDGNGYVVLAKELRCKLVTAQDFIQNCVHFGLLILEDGFIYSEDLRERMVKMDKRKAQSSFYGKKGAAMMREKREAALQVNETTLIDIEGVESTQYNTIHYTTIHYTTLHYTTLQYNTIQYNTIQYNTIQYNTIQYNTGIEIAPAEKMPEENKTSEVTQQLNTHIAMLMKDEIYFVHPHCMARGITPQQLQAWLQAFNKHLCYTGDVHKSEKDYRLHFAHWFKFQDAGSDATAYNPLPDAITKPQPPNTPGKSYDEILAERQRDVDGV